MEEGRLFLADAAAILVDCACVSMFIVSEGNANMVMDILGSRSLSKPIERACIHVSRSCSCLEIVCVHRLEYAGWLLGAGKGVVVLSWP